MVSKTAKFIRSAMLVSSLAFGPGTAVGQTIAESSAPQKPATVQIDTARLGGLLRDSAEIADRKGVSCEAAASEKRDARLRAEIASAICTALIIAAYAIYRAEKRGEAAAKAKRERKATQRSGYLW